MDDVLLRKLQWTGCDVRADRLTRILYATDASIYQIEPQGVAFPRSAQEASSVMSIAADAGLAITPRGAGTSLVGNAIGDGLIVDFSRHNRQISDLNLEARSVCVGAGVVLDQLNAFLKPHGFCFGPDVATSSRATIGGMIANNSSGARVPVYGTTAAHVLATDVVLADGRIETLAPDGEGLRSERERIEPFVSAHAADMAERWPPGMLKRWPGYGIERFLRAPGNLNEILAGSEGTLAAIFSAQLRISPLPREKGLGLIFFASVDEAMQATVELLDLKPAAIEHIDRPLLDQTKQQLHFQAARDLMEIDVRPCQAILIVEFYDDHVPERLAQMEARQLGLRSKVLTTARDMTLVWGVRKAGLSLLTGRIGPAKPVAFIEDAAVRPAQLPEYVRGLESIMRPLGLEASYYGHAASGLLHVRPVVDLHQPADLQKLRLVADQTSALVRQFKGSLSAEHGVGIARTEYMQEQLGDRLLDLMREIKRVFDPRERMNPGKIFDDGHSRVDTNLRKNFTQPLNLPFTARLEFAFKDRSFVGNLEQCNGCGGCRKDAPMMCPTFLATGEEVMSTRGRANVIREVLQWLDARPDRSAERRASAAQQNGSFREFASAISDHPLKSAELDAALSNCLSCKGCTPECPSNVNLALLKAELLYAAHRQHGLGLRERVLSRPDVLGKIGCAFPRITNAMLEFSPLRVLMEKTIGLSAKRTLPKYAKERFDKWFHGRGGAGLPPGADRASLPKLILWDDTFVRYNEPHIGKAAVKVLEALGFHVTLACRRQCCGRPAFSQGNLDVAAKFAEYNVKLLSSAEHASNPIVFLEPSCYSMFAEDYRELGIPQADEIARRSFLFEQFVDRALANGPYPAWNESAESVVIHAHCHAKSLLKPAFMVQLVERLPGRTAKLLDTGCCGMAGAFGMLEAKRQLSFQVANDLLNKLDAEPPTSAIVASGTSCRHQISELSNHQPKHMAELLAAALPDTNGVFGSAGQSRRTQLELADERKAAIGGPARSPSKPSLP